MVSMIPCGNTGHEHHHRSQLQQDQEWRSAVTQAQASSCPWVAQATQISMAPAAARQMLFLGDSFIEIELNKENSPFLGVQFSDF